MANITLKNHESLSVTFKYGNAAKTSSTKAPGTYYYTFGLEDGDKLLCNAYLLNAIRQNWPGRGGTLHITQNSATDYTIVREQVADQIWDLELTEWSDQASKFVVIGVWPTEEGTSAGPQQTQAAAQAPPPPPVPQQQHQASRDPAPTWDDLESLYSEGMARAQSVFANFDLSAYPGDAIGALERMAVSLTIEARKVGLTGPGPEEKFLENVGEDGDPGPAAPPESDDDLPF